LHDRNGISPFSDDVIRERGRVEIGDAEFGLDLSTRDKRALIAFLKTL